MVDQKPLYVFNDFLVPIIALVSNSTEDISFVKWRNYLFPLVVSLVNNDLHRH